ncbi:MAG: bifunctional nuclease family protein [Myxococcota bacterium]
MNVPHAIRHLIWMLALLIAGSAACASSQQTEGGAGSSLTHSDEGSSTEASSGQQEQVDEVEIDPDSPPDGFETMEVFRVVPTGKGAAVLLVDADQRIVVPIFVGRTIAMTIQLRIERRRYTRPLTHDLLDEMVDQLDAEVLKVHIDDVKSGIFVGTVFLRSESGEVMTFDSRSSDAVAMAVGHGVPIFVSRSVIEKAGVDTEDFDGDQVPDEQLPEAPETQPL